MHENPGANGKSPERGIDNLRDVLARLQRRLQDMGDEEANHEEVTNSVKQIDEDIEALVDTHEVEAIDEDANKQLSVKVDREARQSLRRIQAHLLSAQLELGAQHEVVDLVEVIYHPSNSLGSLNYITPRRKTAWVSAAHVRRGVEYLKARDRTPRVTYIEGLLPPLFARNLRQLEMQIERETPLMVYLKDGFQGDQPTPVAAPKPPYNIHLETVSDVRSAEVWWYVWQNAYYDVLTLGVEPLFVGRVVEAAQMGKQINITAYRNGFPFGVARATIYENTAHIVGVAVFKELHTPEIKLLLHQAVMQEALSRGCDLIFAPGETEAERDPLRQLGFMDFGSVVCYAADESNTVSRKQNDTKPLVQPILNLR